MNRLFNEHSALLIIDVQNDFCSGGALAVPDGDQVVPVINSLTSHFSTVVATQDWHPQRHISFAASHAGKQPYETVPFMETEQLLWPTHCVAGTRGAAFHPDLVTTSCSLILRKGLNPETDSYSAFYENDRTTETGLAGFFRSRKIRHIAMCGLATDYCVFFSVQDAVNLGFDVTLITDATKGVDVPEGSLKQSLATMEKSGVSMMNSAEAGRRLQP